MAKVEKLYPAKGKPVVAEASAKAKQSSAGKIIELIEKMSVLELSKLVKELEDKFGVQIPTAVGLGTGVGAPTPTPEVEQEEKTEFDVVLKSYGENKIRVIKVVRELTDLGLKESKDIVDSAPKPIKEKVPKEDAESMVKKLEAAGATCEIR